MKYNRNFRMILRTHRSYMEDMTIDFPDQARQIIDNICMAGRLALIMWHDCIGRSKLVTTVPGKPQQ